MSTTIKGCMDSCVRGVKSYFETDPKHSQFANFFTKAKNRDSMVKFGVALTEMIAEAVKLSEATAVVKDDLHSVAHGFKDARVAFALMNVLEGSLPTLYKQAKHIYEYATDLRLGQPVKIKNAKHFIAVVDGNKIQKGKQVDWKRSEHVFLDKVLVVVAEILRWIGTATFTFAFGVCRPIIFADKHFKGRVHESVRKIGQQFGLLMMICHISSLLSTTADIVRDGRAYMRSDRLPQDFLDFFDALTKNALFMLEKFFETGGSVIAVFRLPAPSAVRLTFAFAAASLGVYKAWCDSAVSNLNPVV